ncbi:LacI family DNA-binding transcriptional regulator [Crassaminicella profunda]|uniref:LacI family DNA-binding transcriptional regulator n=1 Tax=Crassaminicella profunda TaxID=1286698 RepID=UPI001CA6A52C|nr:LacI family DNA-binding transcriptional regulator [Crassaminicella profunda]QZY56047.1 LacI family transcriptional regulator [Crassaminicella profunda]
MSITIKDIAKKLGISYTTVSRALNKKPEVNQATREKILLEAKKMGYQPNAIARGLVKKYTKTMGLIIPDITNPYFPEIARGVEDAARKEGYNVLLCNTNWDKVQEDAYLQILQEKRVDGIIMKAVLDNDENLFHHMNTPLVLLNSRSHEGNYNYIEIDNVRGGFLAGKHLIESGYKRMGFIGGKDRSYSNNQRLEGYKLALKKYHYPIDESIIVNGDFNTKSGYDIMSRLLKLKNPPDAIFAGNDVIALGALYSAQEFGLNIPTDFGIVGFDNIDFAKLPQIQLTTVEQPKYYMGKTALDMLIEEIKDKDKKWVKKIVVEPELIIRKTTRKR